jgi:predicted LPLAT superfamily acyltransferase
MSGGEWMHVAEKGGVWGIRFVVFLCAKLGRRAARLFLHVLALYYVLFHSAVRESSRLYLERLEGKRPGFWRIYEHVLAFAEVTLDRLLFAAGESKPFHIEMHGEEHLRALRESKRGALLVLAHHGSFEAARALSSQRDFAINILGNFSNARMINQALERVNPGVNARLIDISSDYDFVFKVQQRIEAGELVATMGDRVGPDGKNAVADFLGSEAPFPTGPYLLAAVLGCPVYLAFGIYSEPNRYDLYCEPFAEKIVLPRASRGEALKTHVQSYAKRLEHYCRLAPTNWFNFYDFWRAP